MENDALKRENAWISYFEEAEARNRCLQLRARTEDTSYASYT